MYSTCLLQCDAWWYHGLVELKPDIEHVFEIVHACMLKVTLSLFDPSSQRMDRSEPTGASARADANATRTAPADVAPVDPAAAPTSNPTADVEEAEDILMPSNHERLKWEVWALVLVVATYALVLPVHLLSVLAGQDTGSEPLAIFWSLTAIQWIVDCFFAVDLFRR